MALLDFFLGIQDGVVGTYRVTKASKAPTSSSVAPCDMVGELSGPGLTALPLDHYSPLTPLDKWPRVGDILPVLFDRTNPEFFRISWKEIAARPGA
jgi:hypothetical protein